MIKEKIIKTPVNFINEEFSTMQAIKIIEHNELMKNNLNSNLKSRKLVYLIIYYY